MGERPERHCSTCTCPEWVEIARWGRDKDLGWIPRAVLEELGVDCSPLDRDPQGTIWFTAKQAAAIRSHPRFSTDYGVQVTAKP
jgi:hypothetical protein